MGLSGARSLRTRSYSLLIPHYGTALQRAVVSTMSTTPKRQMNLVQKDSHTYTTAYHPDWSLGLGEYSNANSG